MPTPPETTDFLDAGFFVREEFNEDGDHDKLTLELNEELAVFLGIQKDANGSWPDGWTQATTASGRVVITQSWKKEAAAETYSAEGDSDCPIGT